MILRSNNKNVACQFIEKLVVEISFQN